MKALLCALGLVVLGTTVSCQDPALQQARDNKAMVTRAFEVVGSGDYEGMSDYIAEDYVRHCQATPDLDIRSLEDFKTFIRADREVMPDQSLEIKSLVAEGDLVAFYAVYKGTQTGQFGPFPPTGKAVALEFSGVHRVENNKIAETWITWDNIAYLSQLGLYPPPQPAPEDTEE